jgi:hypothetical protein
MTLKVIRELFLCSQTIFTSSNGTTNTPHSTKQEDPLICLSFLLFFQINNVLVVFPKKSIDDVASSHNLANFVHWSDVTAFLEVSIVSGKEFLEQ